MARNGSPGLDDPRWWYRTGFIILCLGLVLTLTSGGFSGLGGSHDLKFGAQYEYVGARSTAPDKPKRTITFRTDMPVNTSDPRSEPQRLWIRGPRKQKTYKNAPDVAPVGFEFDGEYFYIGGINVERTLKYKNVRVNSRVSLVIDDLLSTNPWQVRGLKIHGSADIVEREGYIGAGEYIRVKPEKKWSWGIDDS